MNPLSLIETVWWLGIPAAVLMGVVLGANPAALPLLGTALGLGAAGAAPQRRLSLWLAGAFGAGLVVVYGLVGLVAGSVGDVVADLLAPGSGIAYTILAAGVGGVGLVQLLRPATVCTACEKPGGRRASLLGAFGLGVPAGLVNCPACAGVITGVAASSAALGNVPYSVAVMTALGVGHAAALVAMTWLLVTNWSWPPSPRVLDRTRRISGIVLLAVAGFFLWRAALVGIAPERWLP